MHSLLTGPQLVISERASMNRQPFAACGGSSKTVHDVVAGMKAAGLRWPLPDDVDDAALESKLYAPPEPGREPLAARWRRRATAKTRR